MNLEEIKAREQAATPGPWIAGGCPQRIRKDLQSVYHKIGCYDGQEDICRDADPINADFIAHSRTDIPALIAEVERFADQHKCDVHNIAAMWATLDQQAKNCEELIESYKKSNLEQATENYELEQENATLKKALELMHADAESSIGSFMPSVDEFVFQAQQLTHETHGESEADK